MLQQRGFMRDKVLFRILKSKGATASSICDKLNHNVKNIVVLSEDELCELWKHTKAILLEAQKLCTQSSENKNKHVKEYNLMIKLIRTITVMALETIVRRTFIPSILLQNIMLLHSIVLPSIKDKQAKNEISYLLEKWWKLDMAWKEKVIINAVKYLIKGCKSSLQHIKRLYDIRFTLKLLKSIEDVQELLKLVREKSVMTLEEGQKLMLYLLTLGEQHILGIHNNVKVVLQDIGRNDIILYADLYTTGWLNASAKLKKFIAENCLRDIIFHCFRAHRNPAGRGELGKNLLSLLTAIHESKNQAVRLMIHNQCKPLLWEHLKAPGSYIRCNAVEILFVTNSIHYPYTAKSRNTVYLQKYYNTITDLLKDPNYQVCNVTMNGLFQMLEKHWSCVPKNIIRDWLSILLNYTKCSSSPETRANVFIGLKKILIKDRSHRIVRDFLPNFAQSIYDEDKSVLEALIELLWHAQNQLGMPFWDIVPLTYILDRLETTEDTILLVELIKLLWKRISLDDIDNRKITEEIVYIGRNNIKAIRRFCLHSKFIINWNVSVKLIKTILPMIKEEMECLPSTKILQSTRSKKAKLNNDENNCIDENVNEVESDPNSYRDVQIYIDVIAMLLVANLKTIDEENFTMEEIEVLQLIANILPQFFTYFKETPVNDSVIFLFSLIPPKFFLNRSEILEMLEQQLYDPVISDDTIFTVIYVLLKWNKGQAVLFALTNLFMESLNINIQINEGTCNDSDVFKINERGLELSLRILKHLLHDEYRSVVMNKYHQDVLKFWESLHKWRTFIHKELENDYNINNVISKDLVVRFFNEYISMVSMLDKEDVFDASEYITEMLLWITKEIVPHIDVDTDSHQICIDLMKCTFHMLNLLLKECNSTPKLCCDIVLLYCKCLTMARGVIFLNDAFDASMKLLDFSKMAYENQEPNLLKVIVPNFVCTVMVTLTKCDENILAKQTNNLRILHELTQKYFTVVKSTFNDQRMCLPYITFMLNTAISSISINMTSTLQNKPITKENILITNFPYLATKILKIIFITKKYQPLSVQVLTKTITNYTKIDTLSALVIIHKMVKSSDKTLINKLKNITLSLKTHNHEWSYDTPFDRSMEDAINIIVDTILQE
ncbi:condensin-2 complex subunit G2-like isoform X1 [Hylaeus volcanicus]|uniref:condensin-2 complex subunit G2-like isoform X1 n=1 Tax=Hylaeus volcanicus TaxID=313075 RepID=UPI0023B7B348|nr:condensin-2 complex subunit G2-like isoform X1 [Hylaeus volcanicus]XP_053981261.1 condensin-2 complex subunit G2-like isoform X1 [Hylaeus volcanicus]